MKNLELLLRLENIMVFSALTGCTQYEQTTPHKCDTAQNYMEQRQVVIEYGEGRTEAHLEVYQCANPAQAQNSIVPIKRHY